MIRQLLADVEHILAAAVLFLPLLLLPGFALAASTDIWQFRTRSPVTQLAAALVLSVALVPIAMFLLWSLGFALVWTLYLGSIAAVAAIVLFRRSWLRRWQLAQAAIHRPWAIAAVVLGWSALAILTLVDIPLGQSLYPTELTLDHSYRTEFVAAAARATGLPPASPFFLDAAHPVPFRYHYFWFMLCGAVVRISGFHVGARDALFASIVWAGLAGIAMLTLYLKLFFGYRDATRRGLILVGTMCIGGLQVLAFFAAMAWRLHRGKPALFWPGLTWIDDDGKIVGWYDTFVWVPNHTAALVAGMTALLLLWSARLASSRARALPLAALAGLAMASCTGLSIHLALIFYGFFGAWTLLLAATRRWRLVAHALVAGAVAAGAAVPYLLSLRSSTGHGDAFLRFVVRTSIFSEWIVAHLHLAPAGLAASLIALLMQPVVWCFEIALFVVLGLWKWGHYTQPAGEPLRRRQVLTLLFASTLLITLFLTSGVGTAGTNDLGWRGMLPIQAVLLWCAADYFATPLMLRRQKRWFHRLVTTLVVIGVGSTAAEFLTLRIFPLAVDHRQAPHTTAVAMLPSGNGVYIASLRQALDYLRRTTPANAVVQDNPLVNESTIPGLFMERQTAARGQTGYRFGGSSDHYPPVLNAATAIFTDPALSSREVGQTCAQYGMQYLLATSLDPVWRDPQSWIWRRNPLFANPHARVFACAALTQ